MATEKLKKRRRTEKNGNIESPDLPDGREHKRERDSYRWPGPNGTRGVAAR